MSKINLEALKKAAFSKQNSEDDEKAQRIAACKQKEKEKLDSLILKYFNSDWGYSINNSLMRACEKSSGETNSIELYMNFDRNDFSGWHAFVPFKADQHGMNYNARPVNCIRRFLEYAQEVDMLPGNITFDCWANYKVHCRFLRYCSRVKKTRILMSPLSLLSLLRIRNQMQTCLKERK